MYDIKKELNYAMSGNDILEFLGNECNLLLYRELIGKSLNEILGPYKACVILYETYKENRGHWCVLFEVEPNLIEMFDPYGHIINSTLKHMNPNLKKKYNIDGSHLIRELIDSKYKYIEYNNYPLQEHKNGISTCGRHCCVRLKNRNLTLDEYYTFMKSFGLNFDKLVCHFTPQYVTK